MLKLPWKTLKSIVEYYYMWKTTDRYVQQKRVKAVEAESKLKQVYIPNYTKPSPALITNNSTTNNNSTGKNNILNGNSNGSGVGAEVLTISSGKPCESCSTLASQQVSSRVDRTNQLRCVEDHKSCPTVNTTKSRDYTMYL